MAMDKADWNEHSLRIHRAQSWLDKASRAEDDDTRFLALWIAFNAAYARELPGLHATEKGELSRFIGQICQLDKERRIYEMVWTQFSGCIRILLDNRYVFQPFWDHHNGLISETAWQEDFTKAKKLKQRKKWQLPCKIRIHKKFYWSCLSVFIPYAIK